MIHSLVVGDRPILAAVDRRVCSGGEGIANPLYARVSARPAVDADDIEARRPVRASRTGCKIHLGGPDELVLFAPVDGAGGTRECASGAKADLDEHEAVLVEHYQVDFTMAATIVAFEQLQSSFLEVLAYELLDGIT
jgi:hypothetical protein